MVVRKISGPVPEVQLLGFGGWGEVSSDGRIYGAELTVLPRRDALTGCHTGRHPRRGNQK